MKVLGIESNYNNNAEKLSGMGNEISRIQKELQAKKQELSKLVSKQELSNDEKTKKQELERRIAELEQQLQKAKSKEGLDKQRKSIKERRERKKVNVRLQEDGKGEKVDELW